MRIKRVVGVLLILSVLMVSSIGTFGGNDDPGAGRSIILTEPTETSLQ